MNNNLLQSCLVAMLLLWTSLANAQTFFGTGGLLFPPGAPAQTVGITQSPCQVSGVGVLGGCATIESVTIDLDHTWVGDIGFLLIGPGGQVLELSTGNGGAGDDYSNTVFTDNTGSFITSGSPPYSGTFRPEGRVTNLNNPYSNGPPLGTYTFANTYNGTNADGTWTLYLNDYVAADWGTLNSWSITFNTGGTPPIANAGPDVMACPSQSTTLTATGGGTYLWSTGSTAATTTVMPTTTTTYSVTVTSAGCGTSTDQVEVMVMPTPTVMLSAAMTQLCQTGCLEVTANFTGTPPFNLNYKTVTSNGVQTTFNQSFSSSPATFQVCVPAGTALGNLQVLATSLTDGFCTCQ